MQKKIGRHSKIDTNNIEKVEVTNQKQNDSAKFSFPFVSKKFLTLREN